MCIHVYVAMLLLCVCVCVCVCVYVCTYVHKQGLTVAEIVWAISTEVSFHVFIDDKLGHLTSISGPTF